MRFSKQSASTPNGAEPSAGPSGADLNPAPTRNTVRPPINQQPSVRIQRMTPATDDTAADSHPPFWKSLFRKRKQAEKPGDLEHNAHSAIPEDSPQPPSTATGSAVTDPYANQSVPRPEDGTDVHDAAVGPAGQPISEDRRFTDRFWDFGERTETAIRSALRRKKSSDVVQPSKHADTEYDNDMVDYLDVVDPEISTLSTLTNVQNSLFVPSLGKYVNRRPVYRLSDHPREKRIIEKLRKPIKHIEEKLKRPQLPHKDTLTSELSDSHYAVLPHGERLEGWTHEEKLMLDDLVRHMLHSRRAKLKRSLKGFGQYVRRPLGLFITVYATLITLFGAAWVLFLIGWISLGSKKEYVINVVDNVLVALFAIMGDGLAPFRAVDTFHMIYIAHYHRQSWRRRKKSGLPELVDHNDLPEERKEEVNTEADVERIAMRRTSTMGTSWEYSVLTPEEQARLEHHQRKFSKSHTFYKPHETETHFAFPLRLLIVIVVLLDLHSCLQISLGACTWGISYKTRPPALTTVILCFSITCNILGGVLISVGDHRTRKKEVIERIMRQELTADAKEQLERQWLKEAEERGEIDPAFRKQKEEEAEEAENEEIKRQWKDVPMLPKKLLGKGEDHREPALPQRSRASQSRKSLDSTRPTPSSSSDKSGGLRSKLGSKSNGSSPIPPVHEDDALGPSSHSKPLPAAPVEEGKRTRMMRMLRRADMDMS